ncbi:hypothetical protein PIROE2DRAFT_6079 [Piromyces sp. E2]|nr:hypothetical protein PIROE2DRAFT_6079 [Piromyces sp. E2]|eukprot:OUM66659.1 hypothetical protein PIROE2DRAFT_6079 [Piromyces sp. E2]
MKGTFMKGRKYEINIKRILLKIDCIENSSSSKNIFRSPSRNSTGSPITSNSRRHNTFL